MSQNRPANTFRNTSQPSSANRTYQSGQPIMKSSKTGRWEHFLLSQPTFARFYWGFLKLFFYAFLISIGWVVVLKYVPVWFTPLVISRKIEAISDGKPSKIYKEWRSYDKLSKEVALAVVSSEDQNFPSHWGFDFDEIQDAIKDSKKRKRPRGASTISQQVAKNVFLWNGRSYVRKGLEVYFTVLIELIWGKERILEVYLNVAEMGNMTFGAEAAATRFYGHSAATLSRTEAARIASVLPNPRLFSIQNPSAYTQKRTRQITRQMRYLGGKSYIEKL
ncbi:monofunctional biosynthetic peptidoglycan transglycosylase [Tellurirhabdus bombi]|uniref:monofunctional biosynthetic peptidoglycan transglycosylase n=1 Tax=Tellurirhabdus bombi TaxID=2907205 RepID=UPI001F351EA6|nr:monofunctional biosynthetic peptidoglycan transglycosylase [Tellurirhabdus bombi]